MVSGASDWDEVVARAEEIVWDRCHPFPSLLRPRVAKEGAAAALIGCVVSRIIWRRRADESQTKDGHRYHHLWTSGLQTPQADGRDSGCLASPSPSPPQAPLLSLFCSLSLSLSPVWMTAGWVQRLFSFVSYPLREPWRLHIYLPRPPGAPGS